MDSSGHGTPGGGHSMSRDTEAEKSGNCFGSCLHLFFVMHYFLMYCYIQFASILHLYSSEILVCSFLFVFYLCQVLISGVMLAS